MVSQAISDLEAFGLIQHKTRRKADGKQTSNEYVLLDKANWRSPCSPHDHGTEITTRSRECSPHDHGPRSPHDHKGTPLSFKGSPLEGTPTPETLSVNPKDLKKESTTPEVPAGKPTPNAPALSAQLRDIYNQEKPPGWTSCDRWTTQRDRAVMQELRNFSSDGDQFLQAFSDALRFARSDKTLAAKLLSIDDVFKFGNLVEWSEKRNASDRSKSTPSTSDRVGSDGLTYEQRMAAIQRDSERHLKTVSRQYAISAKPSVDLSEVIGHAC
jgi:hypothetical protein